MVRLIFEVLLLSQAVLGKYNYNCGGHSIKGQTGTPNNAEIKGLMDRVRVGKRYAISEAVIAESLGHSKKLERAGAFDHNIRRSKFKDRCYRLGYSHCTENIAQGQVNECEVFEAWMNSDGHRANIMDRVSTHFGVAHYKNTWTMILGVPSPTPLSRSWDFEDKVYLTLASVYLLIFLSLWIAVYAIAPK